MEQLSQSMFCKNIARLASIQGSQVSIATAKLAIFLQNILWESCSKFNFKQLSHSMFCKNIASLAVNSCCYGNLRSLDTGQMSDILTEHTLASYSLPLKIVCMLLLLGKSSQNQSPIYFWRTFGFTKCSNLLFLKNGMMK